MGKQYARTDELGEPFSVIVDSTSSVGIRETDSKVRIRVSVEEVASGQSTWIVILYKYYTPAPVM